MAGRRATPPRPAQSVQTPSVDDENTSRALDALSAAVRGLQSRESYTLVDADLVIGKNAVSHSLGRKPRHVSFAPTAADAAFAWSLDRATDTQVFITVLGAAQPGVCLLLV
jgi:hypothetical protein